MKGVSVIIGYNRPDSIRRCYESVVKAMYPQKEEIDLIFSLDHSGMEADITKMISGFAWEHGEKKVITHEERMGLRKHVISCGCLVEDYDYLVMLEDDIIVSDSYFLYTKQAIETYEQYPEIVGISLYRFHVYPQNGRFFEPEYNGSDTYLMQVAQSWGQVWTKRMWNEFHEWYLSHQEFEKPFRMADYSYSWDQRSWLRYFTGFVTSENKYLVHPYHAYSTNTQEIGENYKAAGTDFQVCLAKGQKEFRMYAPEHCVHYDAFFEREPDEQFSFEYQGERVLMDLNAARSNYGYYRYMASTNKLNYHVIRTYGLRMRPQEINLTNDIPGKEIYLYDLTAVEKNTQPSNKEQVTRYNVRATSWARLSYLGMKELTDKVGTDIRKKLKKKK